MSKLLWLVLAAAILSVGLFVFNLYRPTDSVVLSDYKITEYTIEGQRIKLGEQGTAYFGNELRADLDGDGSEDVAFIITHNPGGSGTFYYAVAALNTPGGYRGTDGYFLGDRIAPQPTNLSTDPKHVRVVVFNYADRAAGEPMTAGPSLGRSVYLKVDPQAVRWGIVEPDFEGESNLPHP